MKVELKNKTIWKKIRKRKRYFIQRIYEILECIEKKKKI